MKYNWVPVFILFYLQAVHSQRPLHGGCPEAEDIEPCKCYGSEIRSLVCERVNSTDTLKRVFRNAEGYDYYQIQIYNSTLPYIPHEVLENTSAKYLYVINSTLNQIFDATAQGAHSITKVQLQNVRVLRDISWSFFQGFTNLKHLDVVSTPVGVLDPSFSQYMSKSLEIVWFYKSAIKEIKPGALSQLSNLHEVHFNNCSLTSFTRDILPRPWIKGSILYLNNNKISSIPEDLFTDMPNLRAISLKRNFISEVPESAFQGSSVQQLFLSENPLRCDCQLRWLLKRELVQRYSGVCAFPKELQGRRIDYMSTWDIQCDGSTLTDLN